MNDGEIPLYRMVEAAIEEQVANDIAALTKSVVVRTVGRVILQQEGGDVEAIKARLLPMVQVLAGRIAGEVESFMEAAMASECGSEGIDHDEVFGEEEDLLGLVAAEEAVKQLQCGEIDLYDGMDGLDEDAERVSMSKQLLQLVVDAEKNGTSIEEVCEAVIRLWEMHSVNYLREVISDWLYSFSSEFIDAIAKHNPMAREHMEAIFGIEE